MGSSSKAFLFVCLSLVILSMITSSLGAKLLPAVNGNKAQGLDRFIRPKPFPKPIPKPSPKPFPKPKPNVGKLKKAYCEHYCKNKCKGNCGICC